jgi:DnaJ-class molecular chaperone
MTDAYQTLGVGKNATEEEIKKAYRAMASKHHPDKGGDTAKFQEIQSAYETLTDPQKRAQHDNPNPFGGGGFEFHFGGGPGGDVNDIFRQFFHQGFSQGPAQRQPRKNKDLRINIQVTLASTLNNQTKTVSVQTTKGDRFNVDVKIPRGVNHGTTIKFSQQGDNMFDTLTRGDLYVIITVLADNRYEVHGVDLVANLEINSIEAMTGTEREITGLDDRVFLIKIPAGCQYGNKFGLQGQGLYRMNTHLRGDLVVNVVIKTPVLSEEQLNILRNINVTQ